MLAVHQCKNVHRKAKPARQSQSGMSANRVQRKGKLFVSSIVFVFNNSFRVFFSELATGKAASKGTSTMDPQPIVGQSTIAALIQKRKELEDECSEGGPATKAARIQSSSSKGSSEQSGKGNSEQSSDESDSDSASVKQFIDFAKEKVFKDATKFDDFL